VKLTTPTTTVNNRTNLQMGRNKINVKLTTSVINVNNTMQAPNEHEQHINNKFWHITQTILPNSTTMMPKKKINLKATNARILQKWWSCLKAPKNKGPQWTKRNKRTHLHNYSPIESQNNIKQSDPWNEGIVMIVLKHNHTTKTTPCKKMRALATSASAKCKAVKGKKVRVMATSTSAKCKVESNGNSHM